VNSDVYGDLQIYHVTLFEETQESLQKPLACLPQLRAMYRDQTVLTFDKAIFVRRIVQCENI
jgi:hypothetical protein